MGKGIWKRWLEGLSGVYLFRKSQKPPYSVRTITTDAGAREKMFVVVLTDAQSHSTPLLLTHDENRARALSARIQADIDALPVGEFEKRWLSPHLPPYLLSETTPGEEPPRRRGKTNE